MSTFLYNKDALSGTSMLSKSKYLTSLSNLTSTGSKLTLTNPSSAKGVYSLTRRYLFNFPSVFTSTPSSQIFTFY